MLKGRLDLRVRQVQLAHKAQPDRKVHKARPDRKARVVGKGRKANQVRVA